MKRDYYEILGVDKSCDARTLKKSYHKLAMKFHPDKNDSDEAEEKFKEASEAYEVLNDPEKRKMYDRFGHDGLRNSGYSGFSGAGVEEIFSSFGDIFGDLFGFGRGRTQKRQARGADIHAQMVIEFKEAAFGLKKEITLDQYVACKGCAGKGSAKGSEPSECSTCQGRGQVVHGQGMFLISTTCPDCQGSGQFIKNPCQDCRGEGRVQESRKVTVKIPAGFNDGQRLRYSGEGQPGPRGAPPGDLFVLVRVKPHPELQREGDDLYIEMNVDMVEAALGTTQTIEGLEGPIDVDVPKGTQPNDVVTLKKEGMTRIRGGGKGDLHVVCRIVVPKKLSGKQKEALKMYREASGNKKEKKGFFG